MREVTALALRLIVVLVLLSRPLPFLVNALVSSDPGSWDADDASYWTRVLLGEGLLVLVLGAVFLSAHRLAGLVMPRGAAGMQISFALPDLRAAGLFLIGVFVLIKGTAGLGGVLLAWLQSAQRATANHGAFAGFSGYPISGHEVGHAVYAIAGLILILSSRRS